MLWSVRAAPVRFWHVRRCPKAPEAIVGVHEYSELGGLLHFAMSNQASPSSPSIIITTRMYYRVLCLSIHIAFVVLIPHLAMLSLSWTHCCPELLCLVLQLFQFFNFRTMICSLAVLSRTSTYIFSGQTALLLLLYTHHLPGECAYFY